MHPSGIFGEGTGPIFLSSLACDGSEASLFDCPAFAEVGIHNCLHYQDVGVTCIGKYLTMQSISGDNLMPVGELLHQLCCYMVSAMAHHLLQKWQATY